MTWIHRGNRTEIRRTDHALYGPCVEKHLRAFCDVDAERQLLGREGRMQREVAHPGIVPVFEIHPSHLLRKYVAAPTLLERFSLEATRVEQACVAAIARGLCAVLLALHQTSGTEKGARTMVHRDVTPSNVYFDGTRVQLSDFGLAYHPDTERLASDELLQGSPRFVPPELIEGADPSVASDIYQLGLIIAWLLDPGLRKPKSLEHHGSSTTDRIRALGRWHDRARQVLVPYGWEALLALSPFGRPSARELLELGSF